MTSGPGILDEISLNKNASKIQEAVDHVLHVYDSYDPKTSIKIEPVYQSALRKQ